MGEQYDKIVKLDPGIANRWKLRTKEVAGYELTITDVEFIVGAVFRGRKLTVKQGEALFLVFGPPAKFAQGAAPHLRELVDNALDLDRVRIKRLTGDGLRPVFRALSSEVVSRILFKSPGTNITYAPFDYLAIARLITNEKVKVLMFDTGAISRFSQTAGRYDSDSNQIILRELNPMAEPGEGQQDEQRTLLMTIVHEVTHVIQDWKDVSNLRHPEETDAYIAQAIAARAIGHNDQSGFTTKAMFAAAQLVMDQKATGEAWRKAYDTVLAEVSDSLKLDGLRSDKGKRGENERAILSRLRDHIEAYDRIRQSAEDVRRSMAEIDVAKYARPKAVK